MARSTKFDWSILDRSGLINYFGLIYPQIVNQTLTITQFHRIFKKHITAQLPVKVAKLTDTKVEFGWVYVGGMYYSDYDKKKQQCIELSLVYNPFESHITLSAKKFRRVCVILADTILHEIIHMRQYRRRKFKDLPDYASTAEKTEQHQEQCYLGGSDEIDAYSFNIACELMDKFNNDTKAVTRYLNENQKRLKRRPNSWRMYLKAFDHDHSHPIIKRVKTKVMRYLPHALEGKPYRNKDWIGR